jgi:N-acetylated-alpha-linked acidic dipeptidase
MAFPSFVPNTLEASRVYATESHLGTALSRNSMSLLTAPGAFHCPRSWIDIYYPILNTGLDRSSEKLDNEGVPIRSAELVEHGDSG